MTDRKQALTDLLEKVEAGTLPKPSFLADCRYPDGTYQVSGLHGKQEDVWKSYNGSLDAAKALHEAVLPGWVVEGMMVWPPISRVNLWAVNENGYHGGPGFLAKVEATDTDPARAWLIAILKVLIAKEDA